MEHYQSPMLMFELRVHNKCRVMTSNGFMDANTHSHSLFMVVVAVVFTFFVQFASFAFRVIAKSAMTKCTHTHSLFASFSISISFYCMWNSILQNSKKKKRVSLLYNSSLNVIQSSNCFRFSLFHYRWAFVRAIITTHPSQRAPSLSALGDWFQRHPLKKRFAVK